MGYGLNGRDSIPDNGMRFFFLFHGFQTGSEAHPASNAMSPGGFFPGGKATGSEADCSPPFNAEVKNEGAIPLSPMRVHGMVFN
jgi:hypothetical protein